MGPEAVLPLWDTFIASAEAWGEDCFTMGLSPNAWRKRPEFKILAALKDFARAAPREANRLLGIAWTQGRLRPWPERQPYGAPEFGEHREIDGFWLGGQAWLTALPAGLDLHHPLELCGTGISELPDGFQVQGDLNLSHTPITRLPRGLKVSGSLSLVGSAIQALSHDLEVGMELDLRQCPAWDGTIPSGAKANHLRTGWHPSPCGIRLEDWRKAHPSGERDANRRCQFPFRLGEDTARYERFLSCDAMLGRALRAAARQGCQIRLA
jgi:hypothetical protein